MKAADILIIGSGIACTSTLIEVFNKLLEKPAGHPLSITVIEKNQEFWLGVPYGSRSSINALTITSIHDFFTDSDERAGFLKWFNQNKAEVLAQYQVNGGETAKQWMRRNIAALSAEDWQHIYLPRFICGKYQQQKLEIALQEVKQKKLVELNLINAEVTAIQPGDFGYVINYESSDGVTGSLRSAKVVIATGSAPAKNIDLPVQSANVSIVNDLYHPGAKYNLDKLVNTLETVQDKNERNILIVGSNASSIELLYLLAGLPGAMDLINKLVVVSRSGSLPYHIIECPAKEHLSPNLDKLKKTGNYTIEILVDAAKKDISEAINEGVVIAYIDKIISLTIELLQALNEDAKKAFIGIYGPQLSNLFRRSGTDYKTGEGLLHELEKLTLLKGSFDSINLSGDAVELHYKTTDEAKELVYPEKFKVIINCMGSDNLNQSSNRLIRSLVDSGLAVVNLSGKGFLVNEQFEAAPNLYIMGPMLAGNHNNRIHFWHLENAARITSLSPFLAECLVNDEACIKKMA